MADEYGIRRQIAAQEQRLSDLGAEKARLERRLADLRSLESRFGATRERFSARQGARAAALAGFASRAASSKTARRYQAGMSDLLSGPQHSRVAGGLDAGAERIRREIRDTEGRIASVAGDIRAGNSRVSSLECQYAAARRERLERESEAAG